MTTEKPKTPDGLSEATAKFEHATDTAWSELWQDWHRCQQEEDRASDEEDAAADALPKWAKEVRRKRAGYEGKPPDTPAARAAAKLDTPEYRAACAGLDAATQRYSDCGDVLTEVEERILATPAHNSAGVLVKLRIGIRETILNYSDSDGRMPEESKIGLYCRMLLAAVADLESLAGADIGPSETTPRQGKATAGGNASETGQITQAEIDKTARKEDEELLNDLDRLEAARGKFAAFMKQRGDLGREIMALQGQIVEVQPDTFVGAKRMLCMAHTILSVRDVDPGVFLGAGPATAVISQVIAALDDKDGALNRRDAW